MGNRSFPGTAYGLAVMVTSGVALVSQQVFTDPLPRKIAAIAVLVVIVAPFLALGALAAVSAANRVLRAGTNSHRESRTGSGTFVAGSTFLESETKR